MVLLSNHIDGSEPQVLDDTFPFSNLVSSRELNIRHFLPLSI